MSGVFRRTTALTAALTATLLVVTVGPATAETDGWNEQSTGIVASLTGVACPSTTQCWTLSSDKVIATSNGGDTWTTQFSSAPTSLKAMTCASTTMCLVAGYSQMSDVILRTTDGGATWTTAFSGLPGDQYISINALDCSTTSNCWAVGTTNTPGYGYQASIIATTNGGSTWTRQYLGASDSWDAVSCPSSSTCFVAGWGGVARTTNGGGTWADVDGGAFGDARSISCPSTSRCWAMTLSGAIWQTSDGGASWSRNEAEASSFMWGIACPDTSSCIAVGGNGQVYATTTGGLTWLPQDSHTHSELRAIACPTTSVCTAVATDGTVIHTSSGGASLGGDAQPPTASTANVQFSVGGTLPAFPCAQGCATTFAGSGSVAGAIQAAVDGMTYDTTFVASGSVGGSATYTEPGGPLCPAVGSAAGTATFTGSAQGVVRRSTTPDVGGRVTGVSVSLRFGYERIGTLAAIQVTSATVTASFTFPDTGAGSTTTDLPIEGGSGGPGTFVIDPQAALLRCATPGPVPFQIAGAVTVEGA